MIVAIHGAEGTPAQWDPLRELLPGEELLARAAPTALDVDYRPSQMAELVGDAFAGAAAVVGFSWGASVAARFAAAHPERVEALALVQGGHVDFRHLDGYAPPASREAAVAEHGLGGALHWALVSEPNEEIWPALQAAAYPLLLFASAMVDRFAAAVPRAEIVRDTGHDIGTRPSRAGSQTVACINAGDRRSVSSRSPVAGSK